MTNKEICFKSEEIIQKGRDIVESNNNNFMVMDYSISEEGVTYHVVNCYYQIGKSDYILVCWEDLNE